MNGPHFNGPDYDPKHDKKRLTSQIDAIRMLMADGEWRSLSQIAKITGYHEASISAQLRHLRKLRFGSHTVNKRYVGERENGLWEYQLILNQGEDIENINGIRQLD
jgi:hypothetical protein